MTMKDLEIIHQLDENRVLDDFYWAQFGFEGDLSMREKILCITIDDVSRVGVSSFQAKYVCDALGISVALINHHFGGRNELLAEATVLAYENYVEFLWEATQAAKSEPKARLRAWLEESVYRNEQGRGWGAVLNYPTASLEVATILESSHQKRMTDLGELNIARLMTLVGDVKKNRVSPADFTAGNIPRTELLKNVAVASLTASIGWSILGLSVWKSGGHFPSGKIREIGILERKVVKDHIDRLIDQI
jgi:AcrR family transcriptional regulator